ncbi:SIS domain-containing protein [Chloroflexota bacterium]
MRGRPNALGMLEKAYTERRQAFLAGNGGSAATASHMANNLMKTAEIGGRQGFRPMALSDNTLLITALANDEGHSGVFTSQLMTLGQPDDVLVLFSASSNSVSIIRVLEAALIMQITDIAFLGMGGGKVSGIADVSVVVPSDEYESVEDIHMVFEHLIASYLRT